MSVKHGMFKVALLNDQLNAGGAERVIVTIANLLHRKGIEVCVVLFLKPSSLDTLIHPGIPVYYLQRKSRFDVAAIVKLKKYIKHANIVHVHSRYNLRYYMFARYIANIRSPKIVFHEHVPILSLDVFTKLLFQKLDAYIAVLKPMCTWAAKQKVAEDRIYYLPNIVSPPDAPVTLAANNKRIMMAGNIWSLKNQTFAVELLNNLHSDYTLDIYGGINDRQYYDTLKTLIAKYNLHNRINIIHNVNDIYSVIGNYAFAIHTSTHETGPLVLLEYMYAQLPFLTYATGDVVSNIASQLPQFVMNTFSIIDWGERIDNIMNNKEALHKARLTMKSIVNEQCSPDAYYNKLANIYNTVLAKSTSGKQLIS